MNTRPFDPFKLSCYNSIYAFCTQDICSQSSPICGVPECDECVNRHEFCGDNVKFNFVIKNLRHKLNSIEELNKDIDTLTDEINKKITMWSQQTKTIIKHLILSNSEIEFFEMLREKKTEKMSSSLMKTVSSLLKQDTSVKVEAVKKNIHNEFANLTKELSWCLIQTQKKLQNITFEGPKKTLERPVTMSSSQIVEIDSPLKCDNKGRKQSLELLEEYCNPMLANTWYPAHNLDIEKYIFDPSINSHLFNISQMGKLLTVQATNEPHYAIITPGQTLTSPFGKSFKIKRFSRTHTMYIGFCNLDKIKYYDYKFHPGKAGSFLIKSNGEILNNLSEEVYEKCEDFRIKQGDVIEINCSLPWFGFSIKNKTTEKSTQCFKFKLKEVLNMCFVLSHGGNEIEIHE